MQKILKHCSAVLGRVIFIGFGIQIILGLIWMCNAFVRTGSLGGGFICVFQTVVLGGSVCFVLRTIRDEKKDLHVLWDVFCILAVLTFPMIMQSIVIPDIRVLTTALLLFETGCIMRASDNRESNLYFRTALCVWMAAGLIHRGYLCFGAIPMIMYLVYMCVDVRRIKKENLLAGDLKRSVVYRILLIMAVGGIIAGIGSFYQETSNTAVRLASRTAWTSLYKSYVDMEGKDRKFIDYQTMVESAYEAIGIENILWPSLEEEYGTKEAERILTELSKVAWRNGKGQIIKEIIWDMAGYVMPPVVLPMQLEGRAYDSYSGVNYLQILRAAPRFGSLYMKYGCGWFEAALLITVVTVVSCCAAGKGKRLSRAFRNCVIISVTALCMCMVYTMSGSGRMDYKNVLFVLCLWIIWMISTGENGAAQAGGSNGKEG